MKLLIGYGETVEFLDVSSYTLLKGFCYMERKTAYFLLMILLDTLFHLEYLWSN